MNLALLITEFGCSAIDCREISIEFFAVLKLQLFKWYVIPCLVEFNEFSLSSNICFYIIHSTGKFKLFFFDSSGLLSRRYLLPVSKKWWVRLLGQSRRGACCVMYPTKQKQKKKGERRHFLATKKKKKNRKHSFKRHANHSRGEAPINSTSIFRLFCY